MTGDTENGVDRSLTLVAGCGLGATLTGYAGMSPLVVIGTVIAGVTFGQLLTMVTTHVF